MPRPVALLLALAGLALTGISLFNYYANPDYAKPPLREAAAYVASDHQQGDTVLHTSDSSYLAFACYQPQLERHFPVGDPDYEQETTRGRSGRLAGIEPETLAEITKARQRLWLVVTLDHNIEHQREVKQRLDNCYPLLEPRSAGSTFCSTICEMGAKHVARSGDASLTERFTFLAGQVKQASGRRGDRPDDPLHCPFLYSIHPSAPGIRYSRV